MVGTDGLYVLPAHGGTPRLILRQPRLQQPAWQPGGVGIAVVQRLGTGHGRLLLTLSGSGATRQLGRWGGSLEDPTWEPNGRHLLVLAYAGDGDSGRSRVQLARVGLGGDVVARGRLPSSTHGMTLGTVPVPVAPAPMPTVVPTPSTIPPTLTPTAAPTDTATPTPVITESATATAGPLPSTEPPITP